MSVTMGALGGLAVGHHPRPSCPRAARRSTLPNVRVRGVSVRCAEEEEVQTQSVALVGRKDENESRKGEKVVCLLAWDLDNCNPGTDPHRAAVIARRLMAAARRLGGGALGGGGGDGGGGGGGGGGVGGSLDDEGVEVSVGVFRAFGNSATLANVSVEALAAAGVEVVCCEDGPDAADMALGAQLMGFAHAWAEGVMPPPPPFVTPRALAAAAAAAAATAAAAAAAAATDDDSAADAAAAATVAASAASDALLAAAGKATEDAAAAFTARRACLFGDDVAAAVVMVVTTDNDLKPCMEYAAAAGCGVVVCGDVVPGVHRRRRVERVRRSVRRSIANDAGEGVTGQYWENLQAAAQARPVSRLRLLGWAVQVKNPVDP
jgi:hypothetical protein